MCLKVTCHDKNLEATIDGLSFLEQQLADVLASNKDTDEDFRLSWCTDIFSIRDSERNKLRKTAR